MSFSTSSAGYARHARATTDIRVQRNAGTRDQRVRQAALMQAETAIVNAQRTFAQQSVRFRETRAGVKAATTVRFETRTTSRVPADERLSRNLAGASARTRVDNTHALFHDTTHLTDTIEATRAIDLATHRAECERRRRAAINSKASK